MSASRPVRRVAWALFAVGLVALITLLVLLRLTIVTDYLYHATVKDPERHAPAGNVIVAPADGTVLYVTRVTNGMIPQVVKRGVPMDCRHPLAEAESLPGKTVRPLQPVSSIHS